MYLLGFRYVTGEVVIEKQEIILNGEKVVVELPMRQDGYQIVDEPKKRRPKE